MCTKRIRISRIFVSVFIICALFVSVSSLNVSAENIPDKVFLGGFPFGSRIKTNGVMVADVKSVGSVNGVVSPAKDAGVMPGDIILKVNGNSAESSADVSRAISESNGSAVELEISRDGKTFCVKIVPVLSADRKSYKSGLWIRDSAAGIGTVTYVIPNTFDFAGLGHGICDADSGKLIPLKSGKVFPVEIFGIVKSEKGSPGELRGRMDENEYGELYANTLTGVYGRFNSFAVEQKTVDVARKDEVKEGDCTVYTTLDSNEQIEASAKIVKILDIDGLTKNFLIEITDKKLLEKTGGIVQGMSGSPIVQNGKIIGAVTHVLIDDTTKGYGIFIENMLSRTEKDE